MDKLELAESLILIDEDDIVEMRQRENIEKNTITIEIEVTKKGLADIVNHSVRFARLIRESKKES